MKIVDLEGDSKNYNFNGGMLRGRYEMSTKKARKAMLWYFLKGDRPLQGKFGGRTI